MRHTGFVELTGHGIAPSLMDRMMTVTTEFFDRPEGDKGECGPPAPHLHRGYRGRGAELFESFHAGPEPGAPEAPNTWPLHVPMLREVWVEYFDALQDLAMRLEDLFALAMGRPAGDGGDTCALRT